MVFRRLAFLCLLTALSASDPISDSAKSLDLFDDLDMKYCQKNPEAEFCRSRHLSAPICVNNPNLPACGPHFCVKNPDAAGCKQSRKLSDICSANPRHAGCIRNKRLDKFIAWKIQKDCEVDPFGPFCPRNLEKSDCRKDSSESPSSSSSSSSSSSEESSDERDQVVASVYEAEEVKRSVMAGLKKFARLLKIVGDIRNQKEYHQVTDHTAFYSQAIGEHVH